MSSQGLYKRFLPRNISIYWLLVIPFVLQLFGTLAIGQYLSLLIGDSTSKVYLNPNSIILLVEFALIGSMGVGVLIVRSLFKQDLDVIDSNTTLDISDRKQVEFALNERNNFIERITEITPNLFYIYDLTEKRNIYTNKSVDQILGYSATEIQQMGENLFSTICHPDDLAMVYEGLQKCASLEDHEYAEVEYRIRDAQGNWRWLHDRAGVFFRSADGTVQQILGTSQDISDRKHMEISLRENEARLRTFLDNIPAIIYVKDLDGKYLSVNQEFERTLQTTQAEILGKTDYDFLPVETADSLRFNDLQAILNQSAISIQESVELADGVHNFIATKFPLTGAQGEIYAMAGICQDITDRQKIEIDLKESQAQLKSAYIEQSTLLSAMTDVVLVRDAEGRCLKIATTKNINLKGTREEVLSKSIHEELPEQAANIILQTIQKVLASKQIISCDYELDIDGRNVWFASNISPLSEDTVIQISRDINERKLSEIALAKAKEDAETATKAKSEFLANMSHEIRTPMNGVLVMAQLLATTELTEDQQEFVQTILESGDVLLTVINDILDFSKIESGMLKIEYREYVLEDILNSIYNLLSGQARDKGIDLQYSMHPDVPLNIIGDSNRLRQILINIVGNAIKFTTQGSVSVSVSGSPLFADDKYALKFAITDTGIGITGDRIDNLFQAFMQADTSISRKYGGTGLGLAISKRLAELMGGTIWVESFGKVGGNPPPNWQSDLVTQGATFYFVVNVSLPHQI